MTRGCEKKIYYVKKTESPYFEEVWFILKRGERPQASPATLAEEAERIIRETDGRFTDRAKRAPIHRLPSPLAFALGAIASSALIGSAALIAALA